MGGKTGKGAEALAEYRQVQDRLNELMDTNAAAAVAEARKVPDDGGNWSLLRASVLCDAGTAVRDLEAVDEASRIFERLIEGKPEVSTLKYNLANTLESRARLDGTSAPDWWLNTAILRRRAHSLLGRPGPLETVRLPGHASDYERFVAEQRLVLRPCSKGSGTTLGDSQRNTTKPQ